MLNTKEPQNLLVFIKMKKVKKKKFKYYSVKILALKELLKNFPLLYEGFISTPDGKGSMLS